MKKRNIEAYRKQMQVKVILLNAKLIIIEEMKRELKVFRLLRLAYSSIIN